MKSVVTKVSLDITKQNSQVVIPMFYGDTNRELQFSLTENGKPYKLDNCTVAFTGKKADGTFLNNACEVDYRKQVAVYRLNENNDTRQTTACKGLVECQLVVNEQKVIDGETILENVASPYFKICVLSKVYNDEDIIESVTALGYFEKLYVPLIRTIAGLSLGDNIKTEDLADALNLDDYVPVDRTVAGKSLAGDITPAELQTALKIYPMLFWSNSAPTSSTEGKNRQFGLNVYFSSSDNTVHYDLYLCVGANSTTKNYTWILVNNDTLSDAQIASALSAYLEKYPIGGTGADGEDGVGIKTTQINSNGELVITYTDGKVEIVGKVVGADGKDGADGNDGINGQDGKDGEDGYSPKITVSETDTGYDFTIEHSENSVEKVTINHGNDGEDGEKGEDGISVTVASVSESTVDGGSNIVTFSDGKKLTVKNGSKGSKGDKGADGKDGEKGADGVSPRVIANPIEDGWKITCTDAEGVTFATIKNGVDGEDGYSPKITVSETDTGYDFTIEHSENFVENVSINHGIDGKNGADGKDGEDGQDGYTPVRGVDYWTDEDKAEIKAYVDEAFLGGAW